MYQFDNFEIFLQQFNIYLHDHSVAYVLYLYCLTIMLMSIDYLIGMWKAKYFEKNLSSIKGTQGMIKKMATLLLMLMMLLLIPIFQGFGSVAVTVVYGGVIINELISIDENYKVISGKEESILSLFIEKAKQIFTLKKGV